MDYDYGHNDNNYFRFEDAEEFGCLNDVYELYELETGDLPPYCPYRQSFQVLLPEEYMSRMPNPTGMPGPGGAPNLTAPSGPPPSYTPTKSQPHVQSAPGTKAVDPGSIRPCLYRFVYIWPRRGRGFWAWLTFVGRRSVSGFRWNGRRWVYFGIDLRQIESFVCL